MSKVLIVTVGGSPQPIITAIKSLNPDRVVFFCSGQTKEQVIGKGTPCKIRRRGEIVEKLPNLPTYLQLENRFQADRDLITVENPEDPSECYRAASGLIQTLLQDYERERILVDHTGGTKTMTMAAGTAAMDYDVNLYFTSGFRGSSVELPRGETTAPVSTAYLNVKSRINRFLPACLRQYNYSAAVTQLNNLLKLSLSQDSRTEVVKIRDCCRAFEAWDRFDYEEAWGLLQRFTKYPEINSCKEFLGRIVQSLTELNEKYTATGSDQGHGYELVEDFVLNAERRAHQERFDDAINRLYRALGLLGHIRLSKAYNINVQDVDLEQLPEYLRGKYGQMRSPQHNRIELDLTQRYQLLSEFPDDPLGTLYRQQTSHFMRILDIRNHSLFVGGLHPMTSIAYKKFEQIAIPFIEQGIAAVCSRGVRVPPPQFPQVLLLEVDRSASAVPHSAGQEERTRRLAEKRNAGEYDVFLCHNSQDKSAVKAIGEQLKAEGILPWLDEWEFRPGTLWQEVLEQQIEEIKSAAVFIGPDGMGPWQNMEQMAFIRQFVARKCPVIPVILPGCKEVPKLPMFLEGMMWVDFRQTAPDPLEQLIWGITGTKQR